MMMLPTRLRMAASGGDGSNVTLIDKWMATSVNSNSWSINDRPFGGLAGGVLTRHLIAVITCQDSGSASTAYDTAFTFAVTIGGISATIYNTGTGGANGIYDSVSGGVAIAIVEENTLTSGTVTVSISGYAYTMNNYAIALYRAIGLSSAVPSTQPTSGTLVVPSNGFGVLGAVDATNYFGICGAFTGKNAETAYFGPSGAAMLRTEAGSITHVSSNATIYRGATWTFI